MTMQQLPLGVSLPDHAVFASFHAGPNAECVEHLRGLAVRTIAPAAFVWGPPASGKTHLLHALCALADENGRRAAYLPLARAVGARHPAMLAGWDAFDVVCLDDVQAVAGDAAWEERLFGLFNRLHDSGGVLVATADRAPSALRLALADLGSRLVWGGVFGLRPLGDDDRLAALKLRAAHRGLHLPDGAGAYLLQRVPRDMSSLYRLLDSLDREALAAKRPLTVPLIKRVLRAAPPPADPQKDKS